MPLAWWLFAAYAVLSVVFAHERILNTDCSYQLFHSVNDRNFFFQEARYGVFVTQIPMLLGVLVSAPMEALVHLYSAGFVLVYGGAVFLALRVFKSPSAALAIMLSLLASTASTFFHSTTETHLLLALGCLLHASMPWYAAERTWARRSVVALILLWSLWTHPNALFTVTFVLGIAYLRKHVTTIEAAAAAGLCAAYFAVRLLTMPDGGYDQRQYDELIRSGEQLQRFWALYPNWWLTERSTNEYVAAIIMVLAVLLFNRKPLELLFTSACATVMYVVTVLTFHEGSGDAMMEKSFMPITFMFSLLFAELCYRPGRRTAWRVLAVCGCVHAFVNTVAYSRHYTQRLDVLGQLIRENGTTAAKMVLLWKDADRSGLRFSEWATSLDALMLSRCIGEHPCTVFMADSLSADAPALNDPDAFLYLPWDPYGSELKNTTYFGLPRTPYRILRVGLTPVR